MPGLLARDGKPMPGIDAADFKGAVTLVNVWASWCVPCHDEAPLLNTLSEDSRIRIVGINYKDQPDNARRFLGRYGNPFVAAGADGNGRASMEWGVYGVPETFIVGRDGKIAYKLVGPITGNLERVLKPEIEKALAVTPSCPRGHPAADRRWMRRGMTAATPPPSPPPAPQSVPEKMQPPRNVPSSAR